MPSTDPGAFDDAAALVVPIVRSDPGSEEATALDGGATIGRLLVALHARHLAASWDARRPFDPDAVRSALDLESEVPVVLCDARQTSSGKDVLIALVEHAIATIKRNSEPSAEVMAP